MSPIRQALIKLLWRSVADEDECVCERMFDGSEDATDICEAMRALGWGWHWDAERFQVIATNDRGAMARAVGYLVHEQEPAHDRDACHYCRTIAEEGTP